jgi:hypothetical protein
MKYEPYPKFEDETPVGELVSPDTFTYSDSDGSFDIIAWINREREEDLSSRDPVIIEADVLKLNWGELGLTQLRKYGCLFTLIYMDPPWKIRMGLRYPLLTFT